MFCTLTSPSVFSRIRRPRRPWLQDHGAERVTDDAGFVCGRLQRVRPSFVSLKTFRLSERFGPCRSPHAVDNLFLRPRRWSRFAFSLGKPVDTLAQHPYTGAHPIRDTADASRHRCVWAEQSNDAGLGRPRHAVTCRRSHAWRTVQGAWRGALTQWPPHGATSSRTEG
jgi:hypothetical protein